MKQVFFFLYVVSSLSCLSQNNSETIQLLFVGNSLTYTNDLPGLIEEEASSIGQKVKTTSLTYPNYGLLDHWEDGDLQKHIKSKKFDYVIIQQGPSSQHEGREWLIKYGKLIGDLCEKRNTQLVYFMVWPSKTFYQTFAGVIKNHRDAANENDAILCPVGEVWKKHFEDTQDFSYYGIDGFHPSLKGSKIAAEVIVSTLFKKEGNH